MASTFNLVDYDSDDEHAKRHVELPKENLDSAADFIIGLLERNGVNYAVMGGYALSVAGSERTTDNIDIAVDTSMKELWRMVMPETRLLIPESRLVADVMKVYVKTGTATDDNCAEGRLVEVELITPGSNGAPRDIRNHQQLITRTLEGTQLTEKARKAKAGAVNTVKILDVLYLMRNKLEGVAHRAAPKDLHDAGFIVDRWPAEVEEVQWILQDEFQGVVSPFDFMLTPPGSP